MDGQVVGSKAVPIPLATVTPGNGLAIADHQSGNCCSRIDLAEVAVYTTALTSARILAHFEARFATPPGMSIIAGTASFGGGGGAQGARGQACPTSGAACTVDPYPADPSGFFHTLVPAGTYTVTVFPPAGSPSGPQTITNVTVPPNALTLTATFSPPGGLPTGATFTSPPGGTPQQNVVPAVNWSNPSTLTLSGCKGGFGVVYFQVSNTSTGLPGMQAAQLVETPAGSGNYVANIPPLAPLHGLGTMDPEITCPGSATILPDGGPVAGGNSVFLSGSGFTGATSVMFGQTPATSFTVASDGLIIAVAPAGKGNMPVTVRTSQGATLTVGNYNYFAVTGLDTTSGAATGGNTVTIFGQGFNGVSEVLFGLMPASSVTVVSSTEIQAVAPVGIGTVDVQVINDLALSQPTQAGLYTFTGGPPGSSTISEGTASGDAATNNLATQISRFCAGQSCPSHVDQHAQQWLLAPLLPQSLQMWEFLPGISRDDALAFAGFDIAIPGIVICLNPAFAAGCAAAGIGAAIGALAFALLWNHHICLLGLVGQCYIYIDPSGTVIDQAGKPISGATATLLGQPPGGRASSTGRHWPVRTR
jgi:hypothetical protein